MVPAVTGTKEPNVTDCQPDAVSFWNVAVASRTPALVQSEAACVPVLAALL